MSAVLEKPQSKKGVMVTAEISAHDYARLENLADSEGKSVEELLPTVIGHGLNSREKFVAAWRQLTEMYQARLKREGKENRTDEEIYAELARIRQEVADELYPDEIFRDTKTS